MYRFLLGTSLSINTETKTQKKKEMFRVAGRVGGGTQVSASAHSLYLVPQSFLLTVSPPTKNKELFVLSMK